MHSCESLDEEKKTKNKLKNRDPPIREAAATIETSICQQMLDMKFKVSKVVFPNSNKNCGTQLYVKLNTV